MIIKDVKASCYYVPVQIPLMKEQKYIEAVILRIETDNGLVGYSISDVFSTTVKELIDHEVAPLIKGMNPLETEKVWDLLYKKLNIRVLTGVWSSATTLVNL